jgi:recombinational DNA repair protein (RecF pathway)
VTEQLALEGQADVDLLRLALNTLYMLSGEKHTLEHIKSVFELSSVSVGGFTPELEECGSCGAADNITYLDTVGGVCLCDGCVRRLFAETQIPVSVLPITSGQLDAMRYITFPETKNPFSFRLPDEEESALADVCER